MYFNMLGLYLAWKKKLSRNTIFNLPCSTSGIGWMGAFIASFRISSSDSIIINPKNKIIFINENNIGIVIF